MFLEDLTEPHTHYFGKTILSSPLLFSSLQRSTRHVFLCSLYVIHTHK